MSIGVEEDDVFEEDQLEDDEGPRARKGKGKAKRAKTQSGVGTSQAGPSQAAQRNAGSGAGPSRNDAPGSVPFQMHLPPFDIKPSDGKKIQDLTDKYKYSESQAYENQSLDMAQSQLEAIVGKVMRYCLFSYYDKPLVPIARDKLVDLIKEDYREHRQIRAMPTLIIASAQVKMLDVFGIEMKEVERGGKADKDGPSKGGPKTYLLLSALPAELRCSLVHDATRAPARALTLLILALIHMNGDKMDESELWEWLGQLGVAREERDHPKLGRVAEEITKMETCRYLIKSKKASGVGQGPDHTYTWGEAAQAEFSTREVKEFIDKEFQAAQDRQARGGRQEDEEGPDEGGPSGF